VVTDGTEVCGSYEYTGRANCNPVDRLDNGLVTVASAAHAYNPAFYSIVGTPARLADGATSVLMMRLVASLVCASLIGLAAWVTALYSRTRWPLVALVVAVTPVTAYSMMVPAPNGLEMAAALCVWSALIALGSPQLQLSRVPHVIGVLAGGSAALVTARQLGPFWWALIIAVVVLFHDRTVLARRLLDHRVSTAVASCVTGVALAASMWWILAQGQLTNLEEARVEPGMNPWGPAAQQVPLWFLQSYAAFPTRNEAAPAVVYACGSLVMLLLVATALGFGERRLRWGVMTAAVISLTVPFAITMKTILVAGTFWQGRYTLPFSFGVAVLAGLALERARFNHRLSRPFLHVGAALTVVGHVVSVGNALGNEQSGSPLSGDPRWLTAPVWVVCGLTAAGVLVWCRAVGGVKPIGLSPPAAVAEAEGQISVDR
jgi:hypothetical protein